MRTALFFLAVAVCLLAFFFFARTVNDVPAQNAGTPLQRAFALIGDRGFSVLDLSYGVDEHFPAWPGDDKPFEARPLARAEEQGYFSRQFTILEHFATHMDAPIHFAADQVSVEKIPAEHLVAPAVVIDVREAVASQTDYRLTREDVQAWESAHGPVPSGAIVLARTGWAARSGEAAAYRNQDTEGVMHFPGFSVEAARLLIERGAVGLGIDTLSVDYGPSSEFEVHLLSHGAGLFHLENLADLSGLPEIGAVLVAAPMKLVGGSGGPVRVLALVPR